MAGLRNNVVVQFAVLVIAVKAGFVLLKYAAGFLPSNGFVGAIKTVLVS